MWWFLRKIFELVSWFLKSSNESSGKGNSVTDKPQHVNQPTFSSTPLQSPSKSPSSKSSNPLPPPFSSRPSASSSNLSPSPSSLKPPVASSSSYASVLNTSQLRDAFRQLYYMNESAKFYVIAVENQNSDSLWSRIQKWTDFLLEKVTLKLEKATVYKEKNEHKYSDGSDEKDDKIFVAFEIDSVPQRRPFLLSRDMVYAQPSDKEVEAFQHYVELYFHCTIVVEFTYLVEVHMSIICSSYDLIYNTNSLNIKQGFIYRVVKSNYLLVEFGDDFHSQHHPNRKYDISFSFNRVCLKRAHQAVDTAIETSSQNFIFPESVSWKNSVNPPLFDTYHELDIDELRAVRRILSYPGSPPYLLVGPLISTEVERYVPELKASARTGVVVCEAVMEIYNTSEENRILICAPINHTCDALMTRLMEVIPESDMFRANAAFREMDGVPTDILRSCPVKDECFECPPLPILQEFKIILSTYVSSFRLYNEGIAAGHFSHIFLVDASSTTEPEATIALANFANENTSVIVTGAPRNHSGWVRSNMARNYGLRKSYFERLREQEPYKNLNPMFITELDDWEQQPDGNHSFMSFY
ncbi:putative rna helicase sde3 [Quercus suber]|uniref:Rna helicase sde3 n=1 Tax=Quercus suber TaxID=58331 RepID=A0AAW0JE35_QUESU